MHCTFYPLPAEDPLRSSEVSVGHSVIADSVFYSNHTIMHHSSFMFPGLRIAKALRSVREFYAS